MTVSTDLLPVVVPADDVPGPPQGQWTYADYAALPEDGRRYAVVDGVLYMVPSPGESHQAANAMFITYLNLHVGLAGLGRVYGPPFDVELSPDTIVQPDVIVVLNANAGIITPQRIVGAPDLVVELASPGTATHDRSVKMRAYERAGAREYWIADPIARTVEVWVLEQGSFRPRGIFQGQTTIPSTVIPSLPVQVAQFFA